MRMREITFALFFAVLTASACGNAAGTQGGQLKDGWYHVVDSGQGAVARKLGADTYYLHPDPILTTDDFETLTPESFPPDNTLWQVVAHLDEPGTKRFAEATERLIRQDLIFVIDDSLWNTPVRIQSKIPNGVITINGNATFSKEDAETLIERIEAGKTR